MFKRHAAMPRTKGLRKAQSRRFRRHSGLAIVEFALVVPILLTLLIGIMEFGWLVKNTLTLANGAREGARVASLGKTTTEIQTRIRNSVTPLSVVSPNGSIVMKYSRNNGADNYPYDLTDTPTEVMAGKLIKITVRTNNSSLTGFFPFLRNRTVESFATMRRE